MKRYLTTRMMTQAAIIAALYVALIMVFQPIAGFGGNIQFRIAEALTLLPALTPAAIPGLFVGCLIGNFLGGGLWMDIVFGSLATLIAALLTRKLRKKPLLAALPPVVVNMVIVGPMLTYLYGGLTLLNAVYVGLGQAVVCYVLGLPLLFGLKRTRIGFES